MNVARANYWLLGEINSLDQHGYWSFKASYPIHVSKYVEFMEMSMEYRSVGLETIQLVSDIVQTIKIVDIAMAKMKRSTI